MDEVFTMKLSAKRSVDVEHRELMYRWSCFRVIRRW